MIVGNTDIVQIIVAVVPTKLVKVKVLHERKGVYQTDQW